MPASDSPTAAGASLATTVLADCLIQGGGLYSVAAPATHAPRVPPTNEVPVQAAVTVRLPEPATGRPAPTNAWEAAAQCGVEAAWRPSSRARGDGAGIGANRRGRAGAERRRRHAAGRRSRDNDGRGQPAARLHHQLPPTGRSTVALAASTADARGGPRRPCTASNAGPTPPPPPPPPPMTMASLRGDGDGDAYACCCRATDARPGLRPPAYVDSGRWPLRWASGRGVPREKTRESAGAVEQEA
eukprot:scaffold487_cov344-Prasinococcus_capsulatus_cf.AAC.18